MRQPKASSNFTTQGMDMVALGSENMSYTSRSILRSLMIAMEELELNAHNAKGKYDYAHMYLYVLQEQQIGDLMPHTK